MDWLFAPIDPARAHEVGLALSWHARLMVLAWGVLAPCAVLIARYFKVLPGQDWPRELDNPFWWRCHWIGQSTVVVLSVLGLALVLPADWARMGAHKWCGYGALIGCVNQIVLGLLRGSKGGPTATAPDGSLRGHHYDMSMRRRIFEATHKSLGYGVLLLAAGAILTGLRLASGPVWMWMALTGWWLGRS